MMIRRLQYSVALLLVLCVLGISGIAAAQTVIHESHHGHHQSATHGTALCSWMCAAGQIHDASFVAFAHTLDVLAFSEPLARFSYSEVSPSLLSARAPPRPVA